MKLSNLISPEEFAKCFMSTDDQERETLEQLEPFYKALFAANCRAGHPLSGDDLASIMSTFAMFEELVIEKTELKPQ